MTKLLRMNTVALFLILITPWIALKFYPFRDYYAFMIWSVMGVFLIFLWFLLLDAELTKRIPPKIRPTNTMFLINLILILLVFCLEYIFLKPGETYEVEGVLALSFIYILYAWFSIYNHLSKVLTFAEQEKEVGMSDRGGEMVLFFLFFIGVWFLQGRIRKVLEKPEIESAKYVSFKNRTHAGKV
jgi:hypothetical protein